MKWTLPEIETFLSVMDCGTVSGAARRANLTKSVISKRITNLETALNVPLFARHAGRITPTDTAIGLAERLRPALAELLAATESAAGGVTGLRGRLAISAPVSFGIRYLGPVIASFAQTHPHLDLVLDYDDRTVDLAGAGYDVGIRIGQLRDSTLMARKLCQDISIIVASPDYLSRHAKIVEPADLARHATIGYLNARIAEVWQLPNGIAPPASGQIAANNGEAIRDMAIAGLGLALLPLFLVHDALREGTLVEVLPGAFHLPMPISVVWPPVRPMPAKLRMFIDHLAKAFANPPSWHGYGDDHIQHEKTPRDQRAPS